MKEYKKGHVLRNLAIIILAVAISILFINQGFAQRKHGSTDFGLICPKHFRATPSTTIGPNGEIYYRVGQTSEYRSKRGKSVMADGIEYALSLDYVNQESEWERLLQGDNQHKKPEPELKPGPDGDIQVPQGFSGVIDLNKKQPADEGPKLSADYALADFQQVLGNKWECLTDASQKSITAAWAKIDKNKRKGICKLYLNPFAAYKGMAAEKRSQFDEFNKAYKYLIEAEDPRQAPLKIFATRDGSVTKDYDRSYPWICLNFPNVADRLMIFLHEYKDEDATRGKRLDWKNIKKYCTKSQEDDK